MDGLVGLRPKGPGSGIAAPEYLLYFANLNRFSKKGTSCPVGPFLFRLLSLCYVSVLIPMETTEGSATPSLRSAGSVESGPASGDFALLRLMTFWIEAAAIPDPGPFGRYPTNPSIARLGDLVTQLAALADSLQLSRRV